MLAGPVIRRLPAIQSYQEAVGTMAPALLGLRALGSQERPRL